VGEEKVGSIRNRGMGKGLQSIRQTLIMFAARTSAFSSVILESNRCSGISYVPDASDVTANFLRRVSDG
jgi:hypothetical protein